jgi:hypothetical protein
MGKRLEERLEATGHQHPGVIDRTALFELDG